MTYKKRPNRMCSDDFICRAMERIAAHGGITQLHCENGEVIDYLESKAIAEGRVQPTDFPPTCPAWVEEEAINRAIMMGGLAGARSTSSICRPGSGSSGSSGAGRGQRVWWRDMSRSTCS